MIELLGFIFSGFWTFIGSWILLGIAVNGVVNLARAIMRVPITNITNNYSEKKP